MLRLLLIPVTIISLFGPATWSQVVPAKKTPAPLQKVVILGDSLTEGYGVAKNKAFPAILEQILDKGVENSKRVQIINAGISGSTSASATSRLKWLLKGKPDILILALGANDGLRGIDTKATKKNLTMAIELAKANQIKILVAGMKMPPNYGKDFRKKFESLYADIAREQKVPLIPFLLVGVGGQPKLNLSDGIHPNEKGHKKIAETIKPHLEKLL